MAGRLPHSNFDAYPTSSTAVARDTYETPSSSGGRGDHVVHYCRMLSLGLMVKNIDGILYDYDCTLYILP
jgi:hypothetical protein